MTQRKIRSSPRETPQQAWFCLAELTLVNENDPAHMAMDGMAAVTTAVNRLCLSSTRLEKLTDAVCTAILYVVERGKQAENDIPVSIQILAPKKAIRNDSEDVRVSISSKQDAGEQSSLLKRRGSPRAWGFFLVQRMAPQNQNKDEKNRSIIDVFLYLEGENSEEDRASISAG